MTEELSPNIKALGESIKTFEKDIPGIQINMIISSDNMEFAHEPDQTIYMGSMAKLMWMSYACCYLHEKFPEATLDDIEIPVPKPQTLEQGLLRTAGNTLVKRGQKPQPALTLKTVVHNVLGESDNISLEYLRDYIGSLVNPGINPNDTEYVKPGQKVQEYVDQIFEHQGMKDPQMAITNSDRHKKDLVAYNTAPLSEVFSFFKLIANKSGDLGVPDEWLDEIVITLGQTADPRIEIGARTDKDTKVFGKAGWWDAMDHEGHPTLFSDRGLTEQDLFSSYATVERVISKGKQTDVALSVSFHHQGNDIDTDREKVFASLYDLVKQIAV